MAVGRCPFPHARIGRVRDSAALAARRRPAGPHRRGRGSSTRSEPDQDPAPGAGRAAASPLRPRRKGRPPTRASRWCAWPPTSRTSPRTPSTHRDRLRAAAPRGRRRHGDATRTAPVLHPGAGRQPALTQPAGPGDPEARLRRRRTWSSRTASSSTGSPRCRWRRAPSSPSGGRARGPHGHTSTQVPHLVRKQLAEVLGLDESRRAGHHRRRRRRFRPEARRLPRGRAGLPARHRHRAGRSSGSRTAYEHFRASTHARESVHDFRIGARSDGRMGR